MPKANKKPAAKATMAPKGPKSSVKSASPKKACK